jgi:hypothetical protein
MRYKIKWRAGGDEPLSPEVCDGDAPAKARTRELLSKYGDRVTIEIWNELETWRIVTPAGVTEWCSEE